MNKDSLKISGYGIFEKDHTTLIYNLSNPSLKDSILLTGVIGEPSGMKGRQEIRVIKPDLVVRNLTHGGLFGRFTKDRFLCVNRTLNEIIINRRLIESGIKTPEIVAARIIKTGLFFRISVISALIKNSVDMLTYLEKSTEGADDLFFKAGRLSRKIHNTGVYHADLHLKNFLIDANKDLWILDLDKASSFKSLSDNKRQENIRRFMRSCKKWQSKGRILLPYGYEQSFIKGYNT